MTLLNAMQSFHLNGLIFVRALPLNYPRLSQKSDKIMTLRAKSNQFKEEATNKLFCPLINNWDNFIICADAKLN